MSDISNRLREHGPSFGLGHLCDEAADFIESQTKIVLEYIDQHARDSAELRRTCDERDQAKERIKALEAKCALLAASLAQSELEVEERDERIAVLLWIPAAFKAQPVAFEAWAAQYGFHAELIDVHQYAKEAARDAWQAGYAAALARHRGETR